MAGVKRMTRAITDKEYSQDRRWFDALGIILILLGVVSIIYPFFSTVATKIFIGWIILIAGISEFLQAFKIRQSTGFWASLLVGVLYLLVGIWLAFFPLAGVFGLTVLVAITFLLEGMLKLNMAFKLRPNDGWAWMLLSGLVAIIAGLYLIIGLPGTATWAIGVIVGSKLIISGFYAVLMSWEVGETAFSDNTY